MRTRASLRALIGAAPSSVPPAPEVVGAERCEGYERLRIEYTLEPGERVAAFLLVPNDAQHAPAVFCHHQHASEFTLGKSEVVGLAGDPDQAIGQDLATRGFVVFAPDAIGFEERNWSHPTGRAEYVEMTSRLVQGQTLLAKVLHDASVGLDVLCDRPEVDPERLGFIGHSYGGRMALWAAAMDERIRASVSHCGCIGYADSVANRIGIQPEFCIANVLASGDIADVARLVAPRALMLSACTRDKYSIGHQTIADAAREAFPDGAFEHRQWDAEHMFTAEMREEAYGFLYRHLGIS